MTSALRVVVTGGKGALGGAVCRRFAELGASVISVDLGAGEASGISSAEGIQQYAMDVRDEQAWDRLAAELLKTGLSLDVLVAAAGITHRTPILETELDDFQRVLDVNLTGAYIGLRACLPLLREAASSSVILVSSMIAYGGLQDRSAYVASKWGVRGLAKSAALELAPSGVRVLSVHPGLMDTPMLKSASQAIAGNRQRLPLGRLASPDEVAGAIVWAAGPGASYMTGSELVIDGGWTST